MRPPGGELCRLCRRLFDPRHCRSGIMGAITPSACRACSGTGPPPDQGARAERLMHQNSDVRNSNSLLRRSVYAALPTAKIGHFRRSTACIRSIPDRPNGIVLRASGDEHLSLLGEQCCHDVPSPLVGAARTCACLRAGTPTPTTGRILIYARNDACATTGACPPPDMRLDCLKSNSLTSN